MNDDQDNKIYIRLIDGVETFVPVKVTLIQSNLFKIDENQFLDFEDATSIWEFFPGDLVECEFANIESNNIWIAKRLIDSTAPDRNLYHLLFRIVESFGNLETDELDQMKDTINELYLRDDILQKQHPLVKKWIH